MNWGAISGVMVSILITFQAACGFAANDFWISGGGGNFSDNANWAGDEAPTSSDSATFALAGAYKVDFLSDAVNQDLFLVNGSVTFASVGGPCTYRLTGGGGNAYLGGGQLALGFSPSSALNLSVENLLDVQGTSLDVRFGSRLSAASLIAGTGGPPAIVTVDGGGIAGSSTLTLSGNADLAGGSSLRFQNASIGNSIGGTVSLGFISGPGMLSVAGGSTLSVGSIYAGTACAGLIQVQGQGSSITQTGGAGLALGASDASSGVVSLASGGAFTTGAGPIALGATGGIDVQGGTFQANGDISINAAGGSGQLPLPGNVNINVSGPGSIFTQNGAASFTVGHAAGAAPSRVVVANSGRLSTGTGNVTLNPTSSIDVLGGTFQANGNMVVNGGMLGIESGGLFNLAPGRTLTVQNSGVVDYHGGPCTIGKNTTFSLLTKAALANASTVQVGTDSNGALVVDGANSSLSNCPFLLLGGEGGGAGTAVFRNGATASFSGGIAVANVFYTTGTLSIESGAQVTVGKLDIADGGGTPAGTVTVTGANSKLIQLGGGPVTIGQPSGGSAVLNVNNGAVFSTTNPVTIKPTGTVNVAGGTFSIVHTGSNDLLVDGGKLIVSGTLSAGTGTQIVAKNNGLIDFGGGSLVVDKNVFLDVSLGSVLKAGAVSVPYGTLKVRDSGTSAAIGSLSVSGAIGNYGSAYFGNSASGSFSSMNVAYQDSSGPADMLTVDSGASVAFSGPLEIANSVSAPAWGRVRVSGSSAKLTQTGSAPVTIGQWPGPWAPGIATLTIESNAVFTAMGTVIVNPTGTLTAGSGFLNANGGVVVDGGRLTANGPNFLLGSGATLTAQNNGLVDFGISTYTISRSATVNVFSGADLEAGTLYVGYGSNGSLLVDGASYVASNSPSLVVGGQGAAGAATFRNGATGSLGPVGVAVDTVAGTAGTLSIESGAQVTVGKLDIADGGGAPAGTVTVTGANSKLIQLGGGPVTIGQPSGGSAVLNVNNGAVFSAAGPVTIKPTGTVNVGGGTLSVVHTGSNDLLVDGGKLIVSGTLSAGTGSQIVAKNFGLIDFGGGSLTVDKNVGVKMDPGGSLKAGALSIPYGQLNVQGPGASAATGSLSVSGATGNYGSAFFSNTASGSFTSINVAYQDSSGPADMLRVDSGASVAFSGPLEIANSVSAPAWGRVRVSGSGAKLTQTGSAPVTIGQWPGPWTPPLGVATLTVESNATFTAMGTLIINPSGTLTVGSGFLNANGGVVVDGGRLTANGPNFLLGSGTTLTAQNNGLVDFGASTHTIDRSATVNVFSGADLRAGTFNVGYGSNGSLLVDGASFFASNSPGLVVGKQGAAGAATFRNGASGSLRGVSVGVDSVAGTAGTLSIESGAQVTFDSLDIADLGGGALAGTITITGANSRMTQVSGGKIRVGQSSGGSATLNINNGATFTAAGAVEIYPTGVVNVNGGNFSLPSLQFYGGGKLDFDAGSIQYGSNLVLGPGAPLGSDLNLTADKSLTVSGSTIIDDGSQLALNGGSLTTGTLANESNFFFNAGTLILTTGSPILNQPTGTMTIGANAVLRAVNPAYNPVPIENRGEIAIGGGAAAIAGTAPLTNYGVIRGDGKIAYMVVNAPGGEIRADFTDRIVLSAKSSNVGNINVNFGGTISAPAGLTNLAAGLVSGDGILRVGKITYAPGPVPSGSGLFQYGRMDFSGTTKIYGDVWIEGGDATDVIISGGATLTFYNDVYMHATAPAPAKPEIRAGAGSRAVYFGLLKGDVNLTGSGTHCIEGTLSPGFSPGYAQASNLEVQSAGTLRFDLGGTARMSDSVVNRAGHYTACDVAGPLAVHSGSTLEVALIDAFRPAHNDQFQIMTFASQSDDFTNINGLDQGARLRLVPTYTDHDLTLTAVQGGSGAWRVDDSGNASVAANWSGGIPNGVGDAASFGAVATQARSVTLDAPITLGAMLFDNPNRYTVAGDKSVTLQTDSGRSTIRVDNTQGEGHTIAAELHVSSDLEIVNNSTGALTLSGHLDNSAGKQITVDGPGTVNVTGPLTASGNTEVKAGKLVFNIAGGSSVAIAGATLTIDPGAEVLAGGDVDPFTDSVDPGKHVSVTNHSVLEILGGSMTIGTLDGNGTTVLHAGAQLTARSICQDTVTIAMGSRGLSHGATGAALPRATVPFSSNAHWDSSPLVSSPVLAEVGGVGAANVPEPSTLALVALGGLLGLGWGARRLRHCFAEAVGCVKRTNERQPAVCRAFIPRDVAGGGIGATPEWCVSRTLQTGVDEK